MAKEATYPNSKNTCEHTLEYVGVEKQIDDKSNFIIFLMQKFVTLATVLNMYCK